MRFRRAPFAFAFFFWALWALWAFAARDALAVEREHHVGLDVGFSTLSVQSKDSASLGPMAGAHYTYGLSDAFNLIVDADGSLVSFDEKPGPGIPNNRPTTVLHGGVGAQYVLDVLSFVPYGGLLVSGYRFSGGTLDSARLDAGVELHLGMDYRFSRNLSAGLQYRQHLVLTEPSTYGFFMSALARVEYSWGW